MRHPPTSAKRSKVAATSTRVTVRLLLLRTVTLGSPWAVKQRSMWKQMVPEMAPQAPDNVGLATSGGDIDSGDDQEKVAYKRPGSKTTAAAAASTRAPDCAERPLLYFTTGDAVLRAGVLHAARALGVYKIVDGSRTQKMGHVVDRQRYAAPAVFVVGRRPRRSVRLLLSMAQGAWVVRDAWLLDSLSARCWMPCEQYVPSAFPGVLAARRSKADGGQLLNGLRVGYVGNLNITVDEFCQLVEAAGGCFANLCVEVLVQGTGCGSGLTRGAVPVVNQRWLPDSIARWECLSYDDYSDTL